jgi:peptidoglycan hydrolase-like protein with peptidoglycan-binding domain
MNTTKKKILAFAIAALCVAVPLFASASVTPQPPDLLAVISNAFEGLMASISTIFASRNGTPTSTLSTSAYNSVTFRIGDTSVMVAVIQKALIAAGYLKGTATGIFDAKTQAAVEAFQKANKLSATGYLQIATSSLASSFSAASPSFTPIKAGATGVRVTAIQKFLIEKGGLNIPTTTAYFGTSTVAAVEVFQKSHGLPQTGIIDQATFAAMNGK